MAVPIVCMRCGARGAVNKVTASLMCACGSGDIDFDMGQKVAKPVGPGTGWGKPMPDPAANWSDYAGPQVGRNELHEEVNDNMVCPACYGSGQDLMDHTVTCRECNGVGKINPTTGQPAVQSWDATTQDVRPGGAGWHGQGRSASIQAFAGTHRPFDFTGSRGGTGFATGFDEFGHVVAGRPTADGRVSPEEIIRSTTQNYGGAPDRPMNTPMTVKTRPDHDYDAPTNRPYQMDTAMCPNCSHSPTELRKDSKEDAWWHCPTCGPLANIDKHPDVDPFNPPAGFTPDRSMKTGKLAGMGRKTGKLLKIAQAVANANPGLEDAEILGLARRTLAFEQGQA